jgi:hypothetical protein
MALLQLAHARRCADLQMGEGITVALSYMVPYKIRDGRLAPVLEEFTPSPAPACVLT